MRPTGIAPVRRCPGVGGWLPEVPEGWEMKN